ncbi:hypothetical protein F5B18DRAFT_643548 [Nemania serpens]|nr:hypothetical protein F5B18DRAFT_643548 [Nemania serpens]
MDGIGLISFVQTLPHERSEQVANMHNIYHKAVAVDVWLGPADDHEISNINHVLQELTEQAEREQALQNTPSINYSRRRPIPVLAGDIIPQEEWDILIPFLSLRWFHRLWTLQEFALASQVRFLYGKSYINSTALKEAVRFLASHSVQVDTQYGNNDTAGIAQHQRFLLREYLLDMPLLADSLPSFPAQNDLPDYESLLVLAYWHSCATFATDARDYVYGVIGIANAAMDRFVRVKGCTIWTCTGYRQLLPDYKLSTAEVFKEFILRLLHSRFGIRAITIMQKNAHKDLYNTPGFSRQRRTIPGWTGSSSELPSWVPNLADKRGLPLSAGDIFGRLSTENARAPNVFESSHLTDTQNFHLREDDLHVFGRRIGTVGSISNSLPSAIESQPCFNFGLSIIELLTKLPAKHCWTNSTPIEGLLANFGLGRKEPDAVRGHNNTLAPKPRTVEELIVSSLSILICARMRGSGYKSIDELLTEDWFKYAQQIRGTTTNFLSQEFQIWQDPRNVFVWNDDSISCISKFRVNFNACGRLVTYFNRAKDQRLFVLSLDKKYAGKLCKGTENEDAHSLELLGVGPDVMQPGDEIWAIQGSEWPFVLRHRYLSQSPETKVTAKPYHAWQQGRLRNPPSPQRNLDVDVYELQGEAYVHGIMNGELFKDILEAETEMQELVIR